MVTSHNVHVADLGARVHLVQGDVFDFNLEQLLSISRHFHRHFSAIYLDPLWSERHRFSLQHPDFLSMLKLLLGMIDSDGLSLVVLRATQHWDQVAYGLPAPSYTRSAGKVGERFLFWRSRTASVAEANVLHDFSVDAPITGRRERDLRTGYATSDAMGQLPNIQMLGNVVNQ
ncbi:unnamed protein product, partial [Symbiodinium microadriaticum]